LRVVISLKVGIDRKKKKKRIGMNEIMTVSAKGQVTIPVNVRLKFGIMPGDKIIGELRESGFILRKPLDFFELEGCIPGSRLPDDEEDLLTPKIGREIMERG
jgi:AbrB family looped-hinge helix DNA binding protein